MAAEGRSAPFQGVKKKLKADILFGNLECSLTKRGAKQEKKWTFRANPDSLQALQEAGFNLLNIANNHVMDYGRDGFLDTLASLRKFDIPFIGGGKNRDEAERLKVLNVRGLKVGFLGFTSTFPQQAWATPHKPGVAFSDFARAGSLIRSARSRCDFLAVSFHGGTELAEEPNDVQKAFAHLAIDSGADLFIGHHPHVIQALEIYKGKPILYSLGNFLFASPTPSTRPTVLARISLSAGRVEGIDFIGLDTNWGRPVAACAAQRDGLSKALNRLGALSQRFKLVE